VSSIAVDLVWRSRMKNRKDLPASSRSMARLRASWVSQAPVGCVVTPRMWDLAGGVFDDEERVEAGQGGGVDVEQVPGEDRVCLDAEELGPSGCTVVVMGPRRRTEVFFIRWRCRSGHRVPRAHYGCAGSLSRVLGSQAHRQCFYAWAGGWSSRLVVGGPVTGDELSMPASARVRRDSGGRGVLRWSSGSWCRSISTSFADSHADLQCGELPRKLFPGGMGSAGVTGLGEVRGEPRGGIFAGASSRCAAGCVVVALADERDRDGLRVLETVGTAVAMSSSTGQTGALTSRVAGSNLRLPARDRRADNRAEDE
jgi:hypothetical protein